MNGRRFQTPSLIFLNHLLEEYIPKRIESEAAKNLLEHTANKLWNFATQKQNDIYAMQVICTTFSKLFVMANEAETDQLKALAWVNIMVKLGDEAFSTQKDSNDTSKFCSRAHAARSYILTILKRSDAGCAAISAEIERQEAEYKTQEVNKNPPADVSRRDELITEANKQCHIIIRNLAYLGNITKLRNNVEAIFPKMVCPPKLNEGSAAIPYVIQANYIQSYLDTENNGAQTDLDNIEQVIAAKLFQKMGLTSFLPSYIKLREISAEVRSASPSENTTTYPQPSPTGSTASPSPITPSSSSPLVAGQSSLQLPPPLSTTTRSSSGSMLNTNGQLPRQTLFAAVNDGANGVTIQHSAEDNTNTNKVSNTCPN